MRIVTVNAILSGSGAHFAILERVLGIDGTYNWQRSDAVDSGSSLNIVNFLAARARFDEDIWAVELDIADPERFIAETTGLG